MPKPELHSPTGSCYRPKNIPRKIMPTSLNYVIAMPTRNRDTVAIASLEMMKNLTNVEGVSLVVSDNSDQCSTELRDYCERNSIIFVRPPSVLSMTGHWDWLIRQFDWSAITFVADRSFLLDDVYLQMRLLSQLSGKSVVCDAGFLAFKSALGISAWKFSGRRSTWAIHEISGAQHVRAITRNTAGLGLPILLKTVLLRSDWEIVVRKFPDTLSSYGPDTEYAFKHIHSHFDHTNLFLDRIGVVGHSPQLSNAGGIKTQSATSRDFLRLNKFAGLSHSPFPQRITALNFVCHEYNKVQSEIGEEWTFDAELLQRLEDEGNETRFDVIARKFVPLINKAGNEFARLGRGARVMDVSRSVLMRQYWPNEYRVPWDE